jgi:dCTP deaminase
MSVLSWQTLIRRGPDLIDPFYPVYVRPASIDLTLSDTFRVPRGGKLHLDGNRLPETTEVRKAQWRHWLPSGDFVLGATAERVRVPTDLVGRIEGKSSLGRVGLTAHITAGYLDPGFEGHVTLEMVNHWPWDLVLYAGQPICQVSFEYLDEPTEKPYAGRYQGDAAVASSRYGELRTR